MERDSRIGTRSVHAITRFAQASMHLHVNGNEFTKTKPCLTPPNDGEARTGQITHNETRWREHGWSSDTKCRLHEAKRDIRASTHAHMNMRSQK